MLYTLCKCVGLSAPHSRAIVDKKIQSKADESSSKPVPAFFIILTKFFQALIKCRHEQYFIMVLYSSLNIYTLSNHFLVLLTKHLHNRRMVPSALLIPLAQFPVLDLFANSYSCKLYKYTNRYISFNFLKVKVYNSISVSFKPPISYMLSHSATRVLASLDIIYVSTLRPITPRNLGCVWCLGASLKPRLCPLKFLPCFQFHENDFIFLGAVAYIRSQPHKCCFFFVKDQEFLGLQIARKSCRTLV